MQPQWRELLTDSKEQGTSERSKTFSLRSEMCGFLMDIPDVITEVSHISDLAKALDAKPLDFADRLEDAFRHTLSMKTAIESWYDAKVEPRLCSCPAPFSASHCLGETVDTGAHKGQPALLAAIVACVSNSAMVRLDMLLNTLISSSAFEHDEPRPDHRSATIARRQAIVHQSFNFVKEVSAVAAKPLEFGLRQLWFKNISCLETLNERSGRDR